MTLIVSRIRCVTSVACNDEISVSVTELMSNDDGTVSCLQTHDCVAMPPVVEGTSGCAYDPGHPLMGSEGR